MNRPPAPGLNVVTIAVPPLRERREDIPLLLEHFFAKFARANGKTIRDLPLSLTEREKKRPEEASLPAAVEGLERRLIRDALRQAGGIQTRAAALLGISERVLRHKLKKYGLGGG